MHNNGSLWRRGIELHRVLAEGAVAMEAGDLYRGLGDLGADSKGQPDPHRAEGSGIQPMVGDKGRDRLATEIEAPSTDRIASRCRALACEGRNQVGKESPTPRTPPWPAFSLPWRFGRVELGRRTGSHLFRVLSF